MAITSITLEDDRIGTYDIGEQTYDNTYLGFVFQVIVDTEVIKLEDAVFTVQFRASDKSGCLVKTLTSGDGLTAGDYDEVTFVFTPNPSGEYIRIDPFDLDPDDGWKTITYYYDVKYVKDGQTNTWLEGTMNVVNNVTKI